MPAAQPNLCHLCDRPIPAGGLFIVRVDVFADPRLAEMSQAQLESADFHAEMKSLMNQMSAMSADDLQDQVHRRFEYPVCPGCHALVLANPLGKPRLRREGAN